MKKILIGSNIVLAIAVIVLFYLHFSNASTTANTKNPQDISMEKAMADGIKIAYINSDSLGLNYKYSIALNEKFMTDAKIRRNKLQNKQYQLQSAFKEYKNKLSVMTQYERSLKEKNLQQMKQEFMALQQEMQLLAAQQEQIQFQKLYDTIKSFSANYAKKHNIDLILAISSGSGVLYGNRAFDITKTAIEILNKNYSQTNSDTLK